MTGERLSFAILGAGALGSILGAHLAREGHPVVMLARGRRAEQVRAHGLCIRGLARLDQFVPVLIDASQCPDADVLIVATKAHDTAAALEPLRRTRFGVALSVQNGVLKNELLAAAFGDERVLGALADSSGELKADGEVLFTRNELIALGELGGRDTGARGADGRGDSRIDGGRASALAHALVAAGIAARAVPDIESLEWCKFASWVGLMVLSVTTRAGTSQYLTDPDAARLLVGLVREMGALAVASGSALSDRVTLPVATLCSVSEAEAAARVQEFGRRLRTHAPEHRMSSLQDLAAGRALEIGETLGDAVRRARLLGLSLPLLDAFHALTAGIDRIARHADGV